MEDGGCAVQKVPRELGRGAATLVCVTVVPLTGPRGKVCALTRRHAPPGPAAGGLVGHNQLPLIFWVHSPYPKLLLPIHLTISLVRDGMRDKT